MVCRKKILQILYEVGLVGVRVEKGGNLKFCYGDNPVLSDYELGQTENLRVIVQPSFHRALGIQPI